MHVRDMPQDVLTAALGYHLSGERKRETLGLAALKLYRVITADWQHRLPMRVMKLPAAGQTDVNLEWLNESQKREPETHSAKLRMWLLKILYASFLST